MAHVAQAGKAVGNLVGGLFHKKKSGDSQAAASAASPPDAAPSSAPATAAPATSAPDPYAQFAQLAAFTTETIAINTDAIPVDRFEVPRDWKKEATKASKLGDDDFTCPKSAN